MCFSFYFVIASPLLLALPSFGVYAVEMDIHLYNKISHISVSIGWLMESIMVPNFEFLWHFSRNQ